MSESDRDQVEAGLRNLLHHLVESRLVETDLRATLKALVETLVASGALPPEAFERRRHKALDAAVERMHERPAVQLAPAVDKYALSDLPEIDCEARIPLCRARCCTLTVQLSAQDLDERCCEWDYGRPYQIRKKPDGYCVHSDPETRACQVYERRPAICRSYDCRHDQRIWQDFDKRIPAVP